MPQAGFDPPIIILVGVYLNLMHANDLSHHGWTTQGYIVLLNLTPSCKGYEAMADHHLYIDRVRLNTSHKTLNVETSTF